MMKKPTPSYSPPTLLKQNPQMINKCIKPSLEIIKILTAYSNHN